MSARRAGTVGEVSGFDSPTQLHSSALQRTGPVRSGRLASVSFHGMQGRTGGARHDATNHGAPSVLRSECEIAKTFESTLRKSVAKRRESPRRLSVSHHLRESKRSERSHV